MQEAAENMTSNRMVRYPFADDSSFSVPESIASLVRGCFVDAMVQLKDGSVPLVTGISLHGHTLSFDLTGSTSVTLTCTRSRTRFPVIRGETSWCWYVFVLSSDGIRDLESAADSLGGLSDDKVALSRRCIGSCPEEVSAIDVCGGLKERDGTRLTLQEALESDPDFTIEGTAVLSEGNNVTLSASGRDVSISAVPGSGTGTAPCLNAREGGSASGRIWSSDGHVRLFNHTCYDFRHDSLSAEGQIQVMAKCKACCTCDMYASVVNEKLIPIRDAILAAREKLNGSLADYEDAVRRWNERLQTATEDDIVVTMTGTPLDAAGTRISGSGVSGKMNRCAYVVTVRNDAFIDVNVSILDFLFNGGSIYEIVESYMKDDNTPVTTYNRMSTHSAVTLAPGKSLVLSYFGVKDDYVKANVSTGFFSKVTIEARDAKTLELITEKTRQVSV